MGDANKPLADALQYLAGEIVVTRDKALMDLHPRGDMLLDAAVSGGYAKRAKDDGRYSLTPMGYRRVEAEAPKDEG